MKAWAGALGLMILSPLLAGASVGASQERAQGDWALAWRYRRGLDLVSSYAAQNPQVFARPDAGAPWLQEDRDLALKTWESALDYLLALDVLTRRGAAAWGTAPGDAARRIESAAGFAAWIEMYRWLQDWTARCDRDPSLVRLLDRPVPGLGVPAGAYTRLRSLLEVQRRRSLFDAGYRRYQALKAEPALRRFLTRADARTISARLKDDTRRLRIRGARSVSGAVRPISWIQGWAEVSEPSEDWSVSLSTECDPEEFRDVEARLRPGDIVLIHSAPWSGDVGLPGWWNSAALHVGAPKDLRRVLGVSGPKSSSPWWKRIAAFVEHWGEGETKCEPRFLAANSRGAFLATTRELSLIGPWAVLRPRTPEPQKAAAVRRALEIGIRMRARAVPDDFTGLRLVSDAYGASDGGPRLSAGTVLGREVLSANAVAESFDADFGLKAQQMDLVWFVDERGAASGLEGFRRTWRRPKWDLEVSSRVRVAAAAVP